MEFKIGDIVEAFGMRGVVIGLDDKRFKNGYITVLFNETDDKKGYFDIDGRIAYWHKEPSLKLIERPKKKVKKYKALYKTDFGLIISNEYFTDRYEAIVAMDVRWCYLQLLESTMIELEE